MQEKSHKFNVYSISLGCPKNRVDTEHLIGGLANQKVIDHLPFSAFELVDHPEKAHCIFINTCGFIGPAIEESVENIIEMANALTQKQKKSALKTIKPLLVVGGCLVGRYGPKNLAKDLPEVDLWLDAKNLNEWNEMLAKEIFERFADQAVKNSLTRCDTENIFASTDPALRLLSTGPAYAWLKISEGCSQKCSFCTIPGIRGPLHSTNLDILTRESTLLLEKGVKELVLVAQDLTAWGRDLGMKHGLINLLEKLLPLDGLKRLRLMYLYPAGLDEELLSFLASAGAPFIPYFDVPLQHAHPDILKRMGRPFTKSPFFVIERIRKYFPDAAIRTSLITGFPGETTEHFKELKRFVKESGFAHLGVFSYQAEDGTIAGKMDNQIPKRTRERRRDSIMKMQADISKNWLASFRNAEMEVLVDSKSPEWPNLYHTRTWFQAPEIDGITYVSGENISPGDLLTVEIGGTHTYDLEALA